MMSRKVISFTVAIVAWALPTVVRAAIYSPTQAELNGVVFADFIDNPAPDNAALVSKDLVGADAVKYTFNTDFDINNALWRVAMENTDVTWDLSSVDALDITLSNPVVPDPGLNLRAQIFVRTGNDAALVSSTLVPLESPNPVTVSLPVSRITNLGGNPSQVSSFGIEFFGGDEFLGTQNFMATASTTPQPPALEDQLLYSWETADNPATTAVNESFENWETSDGFYLPGYVPQPDHTHFITTTGATQGSKALEIDRLVTGEGLPGSESITSFRWGSQMRLNSADSPPPGDYNDNGRVDAADYTRWRDNFGSTTANLPNDPTPSIVDQSDYDLWQALFGFKGQNPPADVLAQIANIVNLINDPDAYSISFDLRIEDNSPNPNPAWTNMFLALWTRAFDMNEIDDAWWQSAQVDVDLSGLATGPVTTTLDFLLSQFDDTYQNGIQSLKATGLNPAPYFLGIELATSAPIDGAPVTFKYYIDNFRIRHIASGSGVAAGGSVPEPASCLLAMVAMLTPSGMARRRSSA